MGHEKILKFLIAVQEDVLKFNKQVLRIYIMTL